MHSKFEPQWDYFSNLSRENAPEGERAADTWLQSLPTEQSTRSDAGCMETRVPTWDQTYC